MLAGALLAVGLAAAHAQNFSFGLWGDMPCQRNDDDPKIPSLNRSVNQSDIAFSLYNGDIKDGELNEPVVSVPGDNEGTDCHRLNNGGYDALERLTCLPKSWLARWVARLNAR